MPSKKDDKPTLDLRPPGAPNRRWLVLNTPFSGLWLRALLSRRKRPGSAFFGSVGIKANYIVSTVVYLGGSFGLSGWILSLKTVKLSPWTNAGVVVLLMIFNALPILWWWLMTQSFQTWLKRAVGVDKKYEEERFKANGEHAKAFFTVVTTLVGGLILKIVIEGSLPPPQK